MLQGEVESGELAGVVVEPTLIRCRLLEVEQVAVVGLEGKMGALNIFTALATAPLDGKALEVSHSVRSAFRTYRLTREVGDGASNTTVDLRDGAPETKLAGIGAHDELLRPVREGEDRWADKLLLEPVDLSFVFCTPGSAEGQILS